jgi:hypothetical protein
MKMPWNRDELGRELHASRPTPPAELESSLEHDIEAERRRSRDSFPRYRLGLAATATALMVASFTVAGGMAAASSSVRHAFTNVAQVVHLSAPAKTRAAKPASKPATPADDQYGRKKNCVKSAAARRAASIKAAQAKLLADRNVARKANKQARANARNLAAAKKNAAVKRAYGRYLAARQAASKKYAASVAKANKRYKADAKKCPVA